MIFIRRIVGHSMNPSLHQGDLVIIARFLRSRRGSIVLARYNDREIIKRVGNIDRDKVFLLGDNASASTDSRYFGAIDKKYIKGRLVMTLHFAKAAPAPAPTTQRLVLIPYLLGVITVMLLLSQLFFFDTFVPAASSYFLSGANSPSAQVLIAVLVLSELFALPFLLRMFVSPLARACSAMLSVFAYALIFSVLLINLVDTDKEVLMGVPAIFRNLYIDTFLAAVLLGMAIWSLSINNLTEVVDRLKKQHP